MTRQLKFLASDFKDLLADLDQIIQVNDKEENELDQWRKAGALLNCNDPVKLAMKAQELNGK